MPRRRVTQSGEAAQPTSTGMPGVRYGEGVQLQQLQQALPTPNARASSPTPGASQPGLPAETAAPLSSPAAPMPKPGLLTAPSLRPNEPVTAGLRSGLGGGPELLHNNPVESPTGKFLRELARVTGRERFAEMARRSGL